MGGAAGRVWEPTLRPPEGWRLRRTRRLECGDPAVLTLEPVCIPELRQRWLDHNEHVLRSSVHTVNRYRTATQHLLDFLSTVRRVKLASAFGPRDAETFARHLRTV